ncbi:sensor histidine kinase [Algoriphagus boritolerans]|uniref:histidine kinase n=1 Tax=Algoriphagus boritolerans DSM 17298 = JCM 18970 TaxID=1120964 RepID=A0A1H5YXM8_9BACT|nr:ATP-binding protein [Algoriphagus boritolerans]SEG28197.1 Histidine kinase [Algoriphagus boritolerans DSM 17298 = JCM 18970]
MSEQESQIALIFFGGAFLIIMMSTFIVSMVVLHRQRQVQNRQKLDHLKAENEKMLLHVENEIQQETLSHIGRELHDNIGQLLSLAKISLHSSKPEKQAEGKEYIVQIIKEVRALSKTLNLDWVESITLDEFISQQLEKIQSTGFCQTTFESDHSFLELSKNQKLVLIRVIQECLNNAIKHAHPNRISIHIAKNRSLRKIEIVDDGAGFDTSQQSQGSGMINLKKRMETIGGHFSLTSKVGNGTHITLELPF